MPDETKTVIEDGAEIHFTDDTDTKVADRIEILPGGMVRAIYKQSYQQEVYPQRRIRGLYTHTNALEDEEWW